MPYIVRAGSLTVIARSAAEALKVREQFRADSPTDIQITDMDGQTVDVERFRRIIRDTH